MMEGMQMKKSFAGIMVIVLTIGMILNGCSKGEPQTSNATPKPSSSSESKKVEEISISSWTQGAELTRLTNLVKASEKLNEELKAQGKNIQVKIETKQWDGGWDDYAKQFMLAFKAGKAPDIYTTGHETIGWLADGKYIMPLDELKTAKEYSDVFPILWDSVEYKGQVWAALQDTEARPVFYNKDILKAMGWSDDQINGLPEKVRKGEFTLSDMTKLAEDAVANGQSKYGIVHRPKNGPDFHYFNFLFGGSLYDGKENKIVLDKSAVKQQLEYFHEIAQKKLIPDNLVAMEWKNIHKTVVNGQTLFYYGGIWNVFNWSNDTFHDTLGKVDDKWVNEHFGMMLVPAAEKGSKPVTLSHPIVYTVNSKTKHADLVKRLLELVADPELQTVHNIETFHLPFTKGGAENADFKADITLGSIAYMSDYTTFLPNHDGFTKYSNVFWNALQAVELNKQTPDQALQSMIDQLKVDLGDDSLKIVE
jgi:inositol-phosphate transport system substrate-binding protein